MATAKKTPAKAKIAAAARGRLNDALAQAGWAEADGALGEAIAEFNGLERVVANLKGSAAAKARVAEALGLVAQALARAGRRRNLARIGEPGAIVPFAPGEHEFSRAPPSPPKYVLIVTAGVKRGADVLAPALVKPARAPRKNPRR